MEGIINLATNKEIKGKVPQSGVLTIQMKSTNISVTSTFNLWLSMNNNDWDIAQESGTDIADTLVLNETKLKTFVTDPSVYFKIVIAGTPTGNVSYIHNGNLL